MMVRSRNKSKHDYRSSFPARNSLLAALIEYLENSQIHVYKTIVAKNRPHVERVIWSVLALLAIAFTAWIMLSAYLVFLITPTVTSESNDRMAVTELDFPAVVFCSENRISRRAMMNYSEFIFNASQKLGLDIGHNVNETFVNLLVLGKMYDLRSDEEDFYRYAQVHSVLSKIYTDDIGYPISEILASLAPTCENMLKRCKWQGHMIDCKSLFHIRRTYTGNCCAFNYLRPYPSEIRRQIAYNKSVTWYKAARVLRHGTGFGLDLIIDQQLDDYTFSVHSNIGTRIMVFNNQNFPDQISAAVKEKFIGVGEEMFLFLLARPYNGDKTMRQYDPRSRNCVFDNEIKLIYDNFYTLNECLLVCRLKNIRKFCGCVMPQYSGFYVNVTQCNLDDLPCLWRWNLNWFHFEPLAGNAKYLNDADQLDTHCPECSPRCSFVRFNLESSTSSFVRSKAFSNNRFNQEFTAGLGPGNYSVVYINFKQAKVPLYEQNALLTWYEQLAYFGGIASLTLGASFISIVEFIYFWTGRFGAKTLRRFARPKIEVPHLEFKL